MIFAAGLLSTTVSQNAGLIVTMMPVLMNATVFELVVIATNQNVPKVKKFRCVYVSMDTYYKMVFAYWNQIVDVLRKKVEVLLMDTLMKIALNDALARMATTNAVRLVLIPVNLAAVRIALAQIRTENRTLVNTLIATKPVNAKTE